MAMVELEHVAKHYAAGAPVLLDVSLSLEAGACCFLTGASGAGKSTLLNIISLAEAPSRGGLRLFGVDTAALDRNARATLRRRIGIVFQDDWLIDDISVRENVALPLHIAGAPEDETRENVEVFLAWIGLADRADAQVARLSHGERRWVAMARAIIGRPELLIVDEPGGNGGGDLGFTLVRTLEQISRLGTAVLIATDDIAFARQFEHQRFHLDQGMLSDAGAASLQ